MFLSHVVRELGVAYGEFKRAARTVAGVGPAIFCLATSVVLGHGSDNDGRTTHALSVFPTKHAAAAVSKFRKPAFQVFSTGV